MAGDILNGKGYDTLLLAHGAGAPMDSPFMDRLAMALAEQGVRVVRFEFGYMNQRRLDGKKRPPPRVEKLEDEFRDKVAEYLPEAKTLFIGGKSMGGRVASMLAARAGVSSGIAGCVCFGYPFHPPGKLERWRTGHFEDLSLPVLVQQGTRDPFGRQDEVLDRYPEGVPVDIEWLADGEHDFRPRKSSGRTQADLIAQAARTTVDWMASQR